METKQIKFDALSEKNRKKIFGWIKSAYDDFVFSKSSLKNSVNTSCSDRAKRLLDLAYGTMITEGLARDEILDVIRKVTINTGVGSLSAPLKHGGTLMADTHALNKAKSSTQNIASYVEELMDRPESSWFGFEHPWFPEGEGDKANEIFRHFKEKMEGLKHKPEQENKEPSASAQNKPAHVVKEIARDLC